MSIISSNFAASNDPYCLISKLLQIMRKKLLAALVLGALLAMPNMLYAEEVEIQLTEVISLSPLPGDNPLDDPDQHPGVPTRPTDFRASINGNTLSIEKREASIPSAHALVVNAATGSIVINQQFTTSLLEQITTSGVYALRIDTDGGALVGQFVVQ